MSNIVNLLKAKSNFRKLGVTLFADKKKSGLGGEWKFAGEDNLIKTIQSPLVQCGLEIIVTMSLDTVVATLYHVDSGESVPSSVLLPPVTPRHDKNGNPMYLDAEIERGKQFGYWSRILVIRLLGLSDIDAEDAQNRPTNLDEKEVAENLEKVRNIKRIKDYIKNLDVSNKEKTEAIIKKLGRVDNLDDLSHASTIELIGMIAKKQATQPKPKQLVDSTTISERTIDEKKTYAREVYMSKLRQTESGIIKGKLKLIEMKLNTVINSSQYDELITELENFQVGGGL